MAQNNGFELAVELAAAFIANGDLRLSNERKTCGVPADRLQDVLLELHKVVKEARMVAPLGRPEPAGD